MTERVAAASTDLRQGLPPAMVDAARRLAAGDLVPAAPRDAATVILLRDGAVTTGSGDSIGENNGSAESDGSGVEAYLLRRVRSMAFAAGMVVFPGGSVDPRDAELSDQSWAGPSPQEWADRLGATAAVARGLVCAAVRETFEESGVLLAGPAAEPDQMVGDVSDEGWERDRLALLDHSLSLGELLLRRSLVLRSDLLRPWAHWITPEVEPRRYDTRFFVAAMPAGQRTRDVGGEADTVFWARPAEALAAWERSEIALLPPTAAALSDLLPCRDVATVLAAGLDRPLPVVLPQVVIDEDGSATLLIAEPSPGLG